MFKGILLILEIMGHLLLIFFGGGEYFVFEDFEGYFCYFESFIVL